MKHHTANNRALAFHFYFFRYYVTKMSYECFVFRGWLVGRPTFVCTDKFKLNRSFLQMFGYIRYEFD